MTMPFISLDWTLVIQLGNTLILFLILKKILFKPVMAMIEARKVEVDTIYTEAEREKTDAQQMKLDYEKSISGARDEAEQIVKDAQKRALSRSDEIVGDAQKKATDLLVKAEEEIARDKKRAMGELKNEISDIAIAIAEKVVEKDISQADHEALIAKFIDGVGEPTWRV